jgi:hypothetical protein
MKPQDIAKLCYQAAHGAEHLLSDLSRARAYFMAEWNATPSNPDIPLAEPISDRIARVNLAAWKAAGLSPDTLFDLFAATSTVSEEGNVLLEGYLAEADAYLKDRVTAEQLTAWRLFLFWYDGEGRPAVHHSEAYRTAESPAYRLVFRELLSEAVGDKGAV